ncbi:MAG: LysR family transcriptional regulator, partial [Betaproteobacteria bacterium]
MKIFVRIVETGSFSAVAKEENILQPAVSKQLGALEQGLGVRLLNRTTRRISLTEAGKEYYERCHRILDDIDELDTQVTGLQNNPAGPLLVFAPVALVEENILSV